MYKQFTSDTLTYFANKIKALIPTKTSDLTNDSGYITSAPHNKTLSATIATANWSSNSYTYSNANIVTSGYMYVVSPTPATQAIYTEAGIKALDVTTAGQITFSAESTPTDSVTVNILMVNIQ